MVDVIFRDVKLFPGCQVEPLLPLYSHSSSLVITTTVIVSWLLFQVKLVTDAAGAPGPVARFTVNLKSLSRYSPFAAVARMVKS